MLLFHWGLERRRSSGSDFESLLESIGCRRIHWQLFKRAITILIWTPLKFQNMLHLPCVLSASGTLLGWCWLKTCDWCISQLLYGLTVNTFAFSFKLSVKRTNAVGFLIHDKTFSTFTFLGFTHKSSRKDKRDLVTFAFVRIVWHSHDSRRQMVVLFTCWF